MPKQRLRLFLIDGTALAYRSHFAFAGSATGGLSTRDGKPTSATFGFTTTLRALLDKEQPDRCAVAFDGARKDLERTKIYPEYKSTREKAPDEMVEQLDDIHRIVKAHGIPIIDSPGQEADDVIGTLAVQGREAGMDVFIVTSDKDFMQLVGDHIKLWNLRSSARDPEIVGVEQVRAKFGVEPEQMVDLLALMGDSSDNVPGVPRVGAKTASNLLQKFGTLETALARNDEVTPPSIKKALAEHADQARLSQRLVTIQTDVPVAPTATGLEPLEYDTDELRELFLEYEFERLAATLPQQPKADIEHDYRVVEDESALEQLVGRLRAAGEFALDVETTGANPLDARLVGISFSMETGTAFYVPLNADGEARERAIRALEPVLEDPAIAKAAPDSKRAGHALLNAGIETQGIDFDTSLASYLLSPGIGQHDLAALAMRYFSYKKTPQKELLGTGKKQRTFDEIDVATVGDYAAEGADFTWRLKQRLGDELDNAELRTLYDELEMPLVPVLLDMEREGIRVDLERLESMSREYEGRLQSIEERIYQRSGEPFNLNSPAQIGKVLFEQLEVHRAANLKPPGRTKTGQFKTDAAILEKMARHHEVPQLILEYRQLTKLKGTYIDSLPKMVNPATGKIHTTFNQAVAATGRLSSDQPNLQNIPIRTAEGREVRRAFTAREQGWVIMSADYSQIELRILAHISEDEGLTKAFQRDEDIHTRTAAAVHGIMPAMVTPEMRSQAKAINYGIVYGMGATRLASETGLTLKEAKQFIEAYFKAFPGVKGYLDRTLAHARKHGEVATLFGRKRPLPDINAKAPMLRVAAENMAVNSPMQGTAADIMKRAMLLAHAEIRRRKLESRLLLQVHDELVVDVKEAEADEVERLLRETMGGAAELSVPLDVSVGRGWTWLDAH